MDEHNLTDEQALKLWMEIVLSDMTDNYFYGKCDECGKQVLVRELIPDRDLDDDDCRGLCSACYEKPTDRSE